MEMENAPISKNIFSRKCGEVFSKSSQYLKKIDPKKRLNAIVPKITLEDEDLILSAEYYNEKFEMDNSLDLNYILKIHLESTTPKNE